MVPIVVNSREFAFLKVDPVLYYGVQGTGGGIKMAVMTIGKLALEAGVHVETVRYYERRKLLIRPPDRASGYRIYSPDPVHQASPATRFLLE